MMRWVLCWYGRATVNRLAAGSIPASAAALIATALRSLALGQPCSVASLTERFRFQPSKLARWVQMSPPTGREDEGDMR